MRGKHIWLRVAASLGRGGGTPMTAMQNKPARRRSRVRRNLAFRNWLFLATTYDHVLFLAADLARWRPRCGAVLWLQRLYYATRQHAVIWVYIDDDVDCGDALPIGPFETPLFSQATWPYCSGDAARLFIRSASRA